jgi:nitrogen fixation NifU-like protein
VKLDSLYQEIILDHYKHPHGRGLREPYDVEVHHVNPTCGDEVTLRVRVADGVVSDVSYDGAGCSISQASTSVLTDLVVGKPVADAVAVQEEFLRLMQSKGTLEPDEEVLEDAVAFAGVSKYPSRVKCALLGWMAWKDATAQAVAANERAVSEREGSQRERGTTRPAGLALAPAGQSEERAQ